jgi:hypothetical protein
MSKHVKKRYFRWIMLVDPYSETTYRTSFPAKKTLVETRLIYIFFEFFPCQNIFSEHVFVGWISQEQLIRRVSPLSSL